MGFIISIPRSRDGGHFEILHLLPWQQYVTNLYSSYGNLLVDHLLIALIPNGFENHGGGVQMTPPPPQALNICLNTPSFLGLTKYLQYRPLL